MEGLLLTPVVVCVSLLLVVGAALFVLMLLGCAHIDVVSISSALDDALRERRANRLAAEARAEIAAQQEERDRRL
ncbi:MAG TPA: hypothetical protein VG841_05310 [Caulobacterales bacterium]|nr:hypothetical protein [Caulobacterales bacterium]